MISITFSEDVNITADSLRLTGLYTGNVPTLASFEYEIGGMTATWRFEGWALGDQYLLSLSDAITDMEGYRLDGEWVNPLTVPTTNSLVSEFPSGDGEAGGDFNFVMTLLPGDANLDLHVDFADYQILYANYGEELGKLFTDADFDGSGTVDWSDFEQLMLNYGADMDTVWMLADLNGDFVINDLDFDILRVNFGTSGATWEDGDLNGDGEVTLADVDLMFAQYGLELAVVG